VSFLAGVNLCIVGTEILLLIKVWKAVSTSGSVGTDINRAEYLLAAWGILEADIDIPDHNFEEQSS
jgi:hypothetical protein